METNRGVALILALLVLSFLTVLSGALLTTSTIDIWISENYKSATQTLYLAEAGIETAREALRTSGRTTTELLNQSAGSDYQLSTADDLPLVPSRPLIDVFGQGLGSFEVWLRNDHADGMATLTDTNGVVTLTSVAQIGSTRKTIEVTVLKRGFPQTAADPRLNSVGGLEGIVERITRNATDTYGDASLQDFGGPADYRVGVANGNASLGPGTGYGLLLVRGELEVVGDLTWNGLILVIGQGVLRRNLGVSGIVNGGEFVAKTRAPDGMLLGAPLDASYTITDENQIKAANRRFPYDPIAIKER